ncbi:MAG: glycosyltransferase family 2 protein [Pseudobutyrivibrio sp.]|nr:glycosyltransferase family 2 protein [Pseudobutyrivibrio sp.]
MYIYIYQCIDSILGQTYSNLEIIIVNDGSTDKTGNILDVYAKKDDRIKVVQKKMRGW